jgi:hypothetical protein
VIEGEAGFAGSTHRAGRGRSQLFGAVAKSSTLLAADGSSASAAGRLRARRAAVLLTALAGALALTLLLGAGAASAKVQWEPTYTFGPDGTPATSFFSARAVGVQQAEGKLYVQDTTYPNGKVYGFKREGAGELTPLGSPFPLNSHWMNPGALAVDNTANPSKGNFYLALGNYEETPSVEGWSAAGTPLSEMKTELGTKCGGNVDNEGHFWVANERTGILEVFDPTGGEPIEVRGFPNPENYVGRICGLAFDPVTGDLFTSWTYGAGVWRYTAASNYDDASKTKVAGSGSGSCCEGAPAIAIDGNSNRLYVFREGEFHCCPVFYNSEVRVYNLSTLAQIETFTGPTRSKSIAVDEASDTVFFPFQPETDFTEPAKKVQEWRKVSAPIATTGPQTGNEKVSGSVSLDGAGEVTDCWVEYGTVNTPETFTKGPSCSSPAPPYTTDQANVTADMTGLLEGEKTYYYRIAATNGEGIGRGEVKSFIPHFVSNIKTLPASNLDREEARLNASYEGTNEATEYWFEWQEGNVSCPCANETTVQTEAATEVPTNIHSDLTNLKAGATYSYRVVAKNSKGESTGETLQFETLPAVKDVVTKPASPPTTTTTAVLNGSLDPDGYPTTFYFEWGKDTNYGNAEPLPPGEDITTITPGSQNVSAELTELEEGTTYHYRLVAENEFGTTRGADETVTTPQPPSITSFNATNLTASSADLIATINPNGFETEYWFEYGLTKNYGTTVPIPAEVLEEELTNLHEIVQSINGLEERTYHFRLTAKNKWGEVVTEDQTFNFNVPEGCPNQILRQQTGSAYVPDCRAYELVSAQNANGTALFATGAHSPYATGPSKMGYAGFLNAIPGTGEPQNSAFGVEPYMATRTENGWVTRYVGVPGSKALGQTSAPSNEYGGTLESLCYDHEEEGFECEPSEAAGALPHDKTLDHILVWNRRQNGLAGGPKDGNNAPEVYDNFGRFVQILPTNVDEVEGAEKTLDEGGWRGAARISGDYSHYIFGSNKVAFAPGGLETSPGSIYDNDIEAETVKVVSKTESGEDIPLDPTSGITQEYLRVPAVSDDGSHILISSAASPPLNVPRQWTANKHLYMAVNEGGGQYKHFDISIDKDGNNVGVEYREMTSDGSMVLFQTDKKMTTDDTDTSRDVYMWSEAKARAGEEPLTRLSVGDNLSGNSDSCSAGWTTKCNVKMIHLSTGFNMPRSDFDQRIASESGEIYFYSPERLEGARGFPNKRNLYVYRDGKAQFVATLEPNEPVTRINIAPDGSNMAFITKTRLTAYDNAGFSEMYHYNPETRQIKCVSCRPDGKPPTGDVEGAQNGLFMSFDGRTFWSTRDSLVPRDANNNIDVYEFTEGRPQLITTGTSDDAGNPFQKPGLVGVSGDGIDVYFSTFQVLVPQDENGETLKFYDARVNGGFAVAPLEPPCQAADECHGEERAAAARPDIGSSALLGAGGNWPAANRKHRKHRKHRRHRRRAAKCKKAKAKGKGKGKKCALKKSRQKRSRHG